MTAETIESRLRAIISDEMNCAYMLGSYAQLNVLLDELRHAENYPVALNFQPANGSVTTSDGSYSMGIREAQNVMIGFVDRIPFDYDPETVQEQIEALKVLGKRLLARISDSDEFLPVETANFSVAFDEFDANLVMVTFTFLLSERHGTCFENYQFAI